jgi:radical SAM protein with 4Fe4S-binding SPASM domain
MQKYLIDESTFDEDALPFVEELIKNGFLSDVKTSAEANWMNSAFDIDSLESYPFDDLYIGLTDKCNLNCIYCFNKKERHRRLRNKTNQIISKEKIIEVLKEFKSLNGSKVIFTGGEPMLNEDLIDVCSAAKKLDLKPNFITNGTLLNTIDIEKLSESVDYLTISLDSITEKELEILWGKQDINLENSIFAAFEKLNDFSKNKKRMTIIIKPIISAVNIGSLDMLVSVISEKLSDCEVLWAMTKFNKIEEAETDNLLSITEDEYIKSVTQSLRKYYLKSKDTNKSLTESAKKVNNSINFFAFGHGGRFIPSTQPNPLTCNPSFFIAENGDVFPCQCFDNDDYRLGNIYASTLAEMFDNEIFKNLRSKLPVYKMTDNTCSKCEFRYLCTSIMGPCSVNKYIDRTKCKQANIRKLYLQTQLG